MHRRDSSQEALAVVGIGLRFPGGFNHPRELWNGLLARCDALSEVPSDRFVVDRFHDPDPAKFGKVRSRRGGFVQGVDRFDAEFFGYFPAEASRVDPQQRFVLEVAYEALEDAGAPLEKVSGSRTSVFMGSFMYDYLCMQTSSLQRDRISPHTAMGNSTTSIANRLSHRLDLRGPSVTLDTACSASLVAIHLACRSIWNGEADAALAGGVNLILRPESTILLTKGGFLSPDGECRAFDASASGYVRSEGVGIVYIKPLSRALADSDRIYALIRGSAVNQDGYTPEGFTVPSARAQIEMLQAAYGSAGVNPKFVSYVEAHGPGTVVGDPIEARAIGEVLGQGRPSDEPLWIGSIKTNLGHLEGASGVAGFIKAALIARHRRVPPNLHFKTPNPQIDFKGLRLAVPTQTVELPGEHGPLWIGVNSFGAGGTNAHVVLESFSAGATPAPRAACTPRVFFLSARSNDALRDSARDLAAHVKAQAPDLADVAYTLDARRTRHAHGLVVAAQNAGELTERLEAFARGDAAPTGTSALDCRRTARPRIAFVFSGQGGQWPEMGRALAAQEPVFAAALEEFDALVQPLAGFSVLREIERPEHESRLDETSIVQPAIAAIQIALGKLLAHYGLSPDGVVGHSIGEVAAAHITGALTLEEAAGVIVGRARIQDRATGAGRMLAVALSVEEAEHMLLPLKGRVELATINGPKALTLAGDSEPLEQIAKVLEKRGLFARFVNVKVPYHSRFMDPLEAEVLRDLAPYTGRAVSIPLYSSVTARVERGDHLNARYWFSNIREPVRYVDTVRAMARDGFGVFIEVGPHPVLLGGTRDTFASLGKTLVGLPAMTRKQASSEVFATALGTARALGASVRGELLYGDAKLTDLPRYPFQRKRFWFEPPEVEEKRKGSFAHPLLGTREDLSDDARATFRIVLDPAQMPSLSDHRVDGSIVFPATGHLELTNAVARELFPHRDWALEDLRFEQPIVLPDGEELPPDVQFELLSLEGDYAISTRARGGDSSTPWTRCSQGRINTFDASASEAPPFAAMRQRVESGMQLDPEQFYARIRTAGLTYGESFRAVRALWHRGREIFGELELPEALVFEAHRFIVHPALLDACLHLVFADVHLRGDANNVYLPYRIEHVRVHRAPEPGPVFACVRVREHDDTFLRSDTFVYDRDGQLLVEVRGLTCKRIAGTHGGSEDDFYEPRFLPAPLEAAHDAPDSDVRRWVALGIGALPDELVQSIATAFPDARGTVYLQAGAPELAVPRAADYTVQRYAPDAPLHELFADIPLDRRTHVLLVLAEPKLDENASPEELAHAVSSPANTLIRVAQVLIAREGVPLLTVVTRGACPLDMAAALPGHLVSAPLVAALRVLGNELPNVRARIIDLPPFGVPPEFASELARVRTDRQEGLIALHDEGRYVRRVVRANRRSMEAALAEELPERGGLYRFDPDATRTLDGLVARRIESREPGPTEVEIEVLAAGLNFKDVMNAMGLLSERAVAGGLAGDKLGLEVSGVVLRTGSAVTDLKSGDRVMARVAHGFAGRVYADRALLARIPEPIDFNAAATLPVVYVTAHYGLTHLARLQPGETVLIHSGAGGVGLAAIALARRIGARILTTAGSPERRAMLEGLGAERAFDSRSLAFYDDVMLATGGRGVDVVLNSLSGRLLHQSVKCLAPFGRFIEIGKTDIYRNARLGMERLGENISFFAVDVDRLAAQKPETHRQVLDEVASMFARGELAAHPVTTLPIGQLGAALKALSRANVIGKVAVTMGDGTVRVAPPNTLRLRADRSYLISGGAGGFGLEVARFFVTRGARHLVLVSRSGPKRAEDAEVISALEAQGVRVWQERLDIADGRAVSALFERQRTRPALGGIVHSAAVLDDARLADMTDARFARVFAPKAVGAWNLHRASLECEAPLEFFVMFSSISSMLGLFAQSSYAASNQFLDALAAHRQARGLPGLSLNLGVLGDYAGMSRRSDSTTAGVIDALETTGLLPMTLPHALGGLETAILQGAAQRMTASIDWTRFAKAYPHLQRESAFIELFATAREPGDKRGRSTGLRDELAVLPVAEQTPLLATKLRDALARLLGVDAAKISSEEPIDRLGLDSLILTQLRSFILRELEVSYPLIRLLKGPSLKAVATELLGDPVRRTSLPPPQGFAIALQGASQIPPGMRIVTPWIHRGRSSGEEPVRVICFHSMGVGTSLFTQFLTEPPEGIDLIAVQTPGRETRSSEPVLTEVRDVVAGALAEIKPYLDRPFAIWGHSFGGIVAFEAIRALGREKAPMPCHFMVTGTIAPQLVHKWQRRDIMLRVLVEDNSPEYLLALARYVDDADFVRSILPLMRRDAPMLLGYRYRDEAPLSVPITAFSARQDDMVYRDEMEPWAAQTSAGFRIHDVDGDHWFLHRHRALLRQTLKDITRREPSR
jgi:acyl transferase domain-containing protein/NADPH:quinone reductase-like Zn-dependent oxidoreductase/surfactin synthase thioesterase subunit